MRYFVISLVVVVTSVNCLVIARAVWQYFVIGFAVIVASDHLTVLSRRELYGGILLSALLLLLLLLQSTFLS